MEAQVMFYDYITDKKEELAIEFLKNPFLDFDRLGDIE
jgi:hypothetical protein